MYLPTELELLRLTQFYLLLSLVVHDGTDGWQCDPWFKTQVKAIASEFAVYKMMN